MRKWQVMAGVLVLVAILRCAQAINEKENIHREIEKVLNQEQMENADKKAAGNDLGIAIGGTFDTLIRSRAGSKNKYIEADSDTGDSSLFVKTGDVWRITNKGPYVTIENLGRKQVATGKFLSGDTSTGIVNIVFSGPGTRWILTGSKSTGYNFKNSDDSSVKYKYLDAILERNALQLSPITGGKYKGTWWDLESPPVKPTSKPEINDLGLSVAQSIDVNLECRAVAKPKYLYLDGRTGDGSVGLAAYTSFPYTGTKWRLRREAEYYTLECLGHINNANFKFLFGNKNSGTIGLVSNAVSYSGAQWQIQGNKANGYTFTCLGEPKSSNRVFLDGLTANNGVQLAPSTVIPPYTGTWWNIVRANN